MRIVASALILSVATVYGASAAETDDFQLKTANDLADLCAAVDDTAAVHMCHGFMVGVHQMHQAVSEATGRGVYCVPDDGSVTRNTAQTDYVGWLRLTPSAVEMTARDGLLEWARTAYPCN